MEQAFKAAVEAELLREPIPGLRVPVEFDIDDRTWQPTPLDPEPTGWPIARLYEAGWANTPLPGSGLAPREYASWLDVGQVERDAGRLPTPPPHRLDRRPVRRRHCGRVVLEQHDVAGIG